MKKLKKFWDVIYDFSFDVVMVITIVWGMYLAIALTINFPILGIPILIIGVLVAILKRKDEIEKFIINF